MRTSPGSASRGKSRCGASPSTSRPIATRSSKLERSLVYPSFESRAEIARLVAERDAKATLAARSGRRAALSRATRSGSAPRNAAPRIAAGEPYALRLDMNAAVARTGALTWVEIGAARRSTKP